MQQSMPSCHGSKSFVGRIGQPKNGTLQSSQNKGRFGATTHAEATIAGQQSQVYANLEQTAQKTLRSTANTQPITNLSINSRTGGTGQSFGSKAFGFSKSSTATGPGVRGIGEMPKQEEYQQVNAFGQSWAGQQPNLSQGGPSNKSGKVKQSLLSDVQRLQVQAKKFIDANKFEQTKTLLEKALRLHGHDDAVIHFQCGIANVNLGYMLAAEQMFDKCIKLNTRPFMPVNMGEFPEEDPDKLTLLAYTQIAHC